MTCFGCPLGAVLVIPDEGAAITCFQVAVGVIAVAALLDGMGREAVVDRLIRPFVMGETPRGIVVVVFAVRVGGCPLGAVLVAIAEAVVATVVIVLLDVTKAVVVVGEVEPIGPAGLGAGVDVVEPAIAVPRKGAVGCFPTVIPAALP